MTVKLIDPVMLAPGWTFSSLGPVQSDGTNPNRAARLPVVLNGPRTGLIGVSGHLWLGTCPSVIVRAGDRSITLTSAHTSYPEFGMTTRASRVVVTPGAGCAADQQILIYGLSIRPISPPTPSNNVLWVSGIALLVLLLLGWRLLFRPA